MIKIVVASENPVKIKAALLGFEKMFPDESFTAEGVAVGSGVSDQPSTDSETLQGAYNRAENASQVVPDADYWVGLEGGIEIAGIETQAFAWMVVRSKHGVVGKGRTGAFFLPTKVTELMQQGKELGHANDVVFGSSNSKQKGGATGLLTKNVVDRADHYAEAVVLALIPFRNPDLY